MVVRGHVEDLRRFVAGSVVAAVGEAETPPQWTQQVPRMQVSMHLSLDQSISGSFCVQSRVLVHQKNKVKKDDVDDQIIDTLFE
jgi:hypothetical protein